MIERQTTSSGKEFHSVNTADVYDDGFLRVEHDKYHISCGGEAIKLRRCEFLIVSLLAQNAERYMSMQAIWNHLWRGRKDFNHESLKVIVSRLRRTLEPFDIRIETMVTFGYKLVPVKKNQSLNDRCGAADDYSVGRVLK